MAQGDERRVRATRLSAQAWDVVLDAGRRGDVPPAVWAELAARGMAQGERLSPAWQQVASALGTTTAIEVDARHSRMRHRSRVTVLGKVAVVTTQRLVATDDAMTGEPTVLVQVVPPDDVMDALAAHLPPVAELRTDDGASGTAPLTVPLDLEAAVHGQRGGLDGSGARPAPLRAPAETPGPGTGWLSTEGLQVEPTRTSLRADDEVAEAVGAVLGSVDDDTVLGGEDAARLLGSVPGLDPRLADLAAGAESEVLVLVQPGARPTSGEEAMSMLAGLALRLWVVTEHGLVCLRADREGVDVLGVEPGDLAREVRSLVVSTDASTPLAGERS